MDTDTSTHTTNNGTKQHASHAPVGNALVRRGGGNPSAQHRLKAAEAMHSTHL